MSLCVSSGLYFPFSPSFFRNGRGTAPALHLPVLRPPARGILSLVFPLLLLALCCALALPQIHGKLRYFTQKIISHGTVGK